MITTTMRIERPEGTIIATGLTVQIDLASSQLFADEDHERPHQLYDLYFETIPAVGVRRRDLVIDEQHLDPVTNTNTRYRVTAAEAFDNDHLECRAQLVIGG